MKAYRVIASTGAHGLEESLNALADEGWTVLSVCPGGSSSLIVVLEQDNPDRVINLEARASAAEADERAVLHEHSSP